MGVLGAICPGKYAEIDLEGRLYEVMRVDLMCVKYIYQCW